MNIEDLWAKQKPLGNIDVIKRDFSEGRVPELPYYIIGQNGAKNKISDVLSDIDGMRMQTLVLRADYGGGKTNMLKYLDLYFRQHPSSGIKVIYQNTNVDQRDLFMVLLRLLQLNYMEEYLLPSIIKLRDQKDLIQSLVDNYNGEFSCLKEYIEKLFDSNNNEDRIRELLLVGTGQLYSIRVQKKLGLVQPLNNFDRRSVLILFLNILANEHNYVIFAIDELENMYNVSKKRMALFLTTYRDLIDRFSFIKGHLLLFAITRSVELNVINPPLFSRISNNIIDLELIKDRNEVLELVKFTQNDITRTKKSDSDLTKIATQISNSLKATPMPTRELIKKIVSELRDERRFDGLQSYFADHADMKELYDDSLRFLTLDGILEDVNKSFFDPLSYYMESMGFADVNKNLKVRDYNAYIDSDSKSAIMFSFNNSEKIKDKILMIKDKFDITKLSLFVSSKNDEISYATLNDIPLNIEMIDYEASELLILLDMFKNNIDKQDEVSELIHLYTHNVL